MGLADYKAQVEQFAERLLRPYIGRVVSRHWSKPSRKEVNDGVWKTVVLDPLEVAILDSPLLQRLRRIRQLGVVHWVYPTAGHSRLEHTLGVVHQVQRVADALNHTVDGDQAKGVPKEWTNILRLSALLHDIGHGLMSHVVENALRFHVPTEALLGEIADDFERIYEGAVFESVKLSEAAAFYMIGSQAFKELFGELRGKFSYHLPVASTEEAVELIRRAVLGQKICEKRILLHEIINGPYDADKLDYMRRDAKMCGLPIVTDIERLIRKLQIVDVPEGKLPERLAKLVQGGSGQTYHVTAIAPSGAQVLDEMMLGRALLSDKVYRHQKVRAIELMVTKMFSLLVGLLVEESEIASLILALEDHLFVDFEWDAISRVLGSERAGSDSQVSLLKNLAERIKHRRPFVRAYSFAQNMWDNQSELEQRERVGVSLLQDHVKRPERCRDLDRKLAGIIRQMQALVPLEFPSIGELSPEDYEHFIGFDPSCPPETSQFTRAFIHQGMQVLQRFERASGESAAWANAYMLTRDLGYVFAAEELRFAAYLAAEVLCFREYQVRTAPNAMAWSKLDDKRIDGLRRSLTEAGFYAEDILPLRFKPKALTNAAAKRAIQQIVNNLKDYNGLTTHEGKAAPVRVTSDRVEEFLLQFRDEDIETMFRVLSQIKILGRSEVHLAVRGFFARHDSFRGCSLCQLGGPHDSSSIVSYYVNDLAPEFGFKPCQIQEALLPENCERPILFADDFTSSGNQATDIMKELMGHETQLGEKHGLQLNEKERSALRTAKIGFLFVAGEPEGLTNLEKTLPEIGLGIPTCYAYIQALPRFDQSAGGALVEWAKMIGKAALADDDPDHNEEWISKKCLGYGNNGYLLASSYNTPTQALTLLWKSGHPGKSSWKPLIPRRKKT